MQILSVQQTNYVGSVLFLFLHIIFMWWWLF